ncbi:hypothetical protein Tco_0166787, partial [Tanacetum coccineum]
ERTLGGSIVMVARMVGVAVEGDDDVWWCMTMVVAAGDGGGEWRRVGIGIG